MRRSARTTILLAAAAMLGLGAAAAKADALDDIKQRGTLTVGVKADYRPYGYRDPSGGIVGLEPDLAADIAKRLGVKLELVPVVASNRMQFLEQGKIDIMIATMTDTPERRKVVLIVDPDYYASGTNLLAPKSAHLTDWSQVKGKPVCLIQGSFYNKELQETYGIEPVAFKGTAEAYAALKAGNCVGVAYDDTALYGQVLDPDWKDYEVPLKSILAQPWGLAVKLGETKFADFMSATIKDWHKSGLILELEKKWGVPNSAFALEMHDKYK
ncbi:MAG TPA: transporter substrate-binding domain-containing protein [Alphaproteobacteria bacterium]